MRRLGRSARVALCAVVAPPFAPSLLRAVFALSLVLLPARAFAIHRQMPFLVSVTPTPGTCHNGAPSQGLPRWVAFESSDDLLHIGSLGQQIFLLESMVIPGLDCSDKPPGPELRQLTRFAEGAARPSTSSSAHVVVFDSTADPMGTGSTARKIFRWDRDKRCFSDGPWADPSGGHITQVSDGSMDCAGASVDAAGENIAFECQGASGPEVFVYSLPAFATTPTLTQIGAGTNPVVNYDGKVVVFESEATLKANTPLPPSASGHKQIYAYSLPLRRLFRLTSGSDDSISPSPGQLVAGEVWPIVAFQSRADLLGNGSIGWQVFVLDPATGDLRQITHGPGESVEPNLSGTGDLVAFLSTSDLLGKGTPGQHLFFFYLVTGRMFEVKSDPGTLWQHPQTGGGNFLVFETTQDMFRTGVSGWQIYVLDTWGRIPRPAIGQRNFRFVEGDPATGSRLKLRTQRWHTDVPVPPGAKAVFDVGVRDARAEAPITVDKTSVLIPPIPLPDGMGAVCINVIGKGVGTFDCDGGPAGPGAAGGDVVATGDHDDISCIGVCAQEKFNQTQGEYAPGGMVLSLPVRVALTKTLDESLCPTDPTRYQWSVDTSLVLTSGTATGNVLNADGQAGATVNVVETGEPLECPRMEVANFAGMALVGVLPILRVPDVPDGTGGVAVQDLVLSLRLEPYEGKEYRPCTGPWCDALTACQADADCNDGISCNGDETCALGPNIDVHEGNCQAIDGCTDLACAPGPQDCDDGNVCNGQETCDALAGCAVGAPPSCDSGAICAEDTCNPVYGCQSTFIPMCCVSDADCMNDTVCDGAETCVNGDCMRGTAATCDDHDACTGVETCDPTTGACLPGTPPVCDDANTCTDDSCDPAVGCVHTPNATVSCDDGNPCTTTDVCANGVCLGTYVSCDNGDACDGIETCDPTTGGCVPGTPPNCDDGNPCTDDGCDALLGCVHTPNTAVFCDDGNPCTTNDACAAGICVGAPVVCDDGDACNGVETCDPTTGACLLGIPLVCSDGNPCTDDVCDPATGCAYAYNTNVCDDGNPCTTNDLCAAGICVGTPDLLCQGQTLLGLVSTANPADLGGARQQAQLQSSLQVINRKLERALTLRAHRRRRLRAAYRRLGLFQLALRQGISRGSFDVPLANDLMGQAAGLMTAVQALISPGG